MPPPPVENVLLQEQKERLHRCVVGAGTNWAHRSGAEVLQLLDKFARAELRLTIRVQRRVNGARRATAFRSAAMARSAVMCEPIEYPTIRFEGTSLIALKYGLPLVGPVLSDVGQPQLVEPRRGEASEDEVVMDRGAGFTVQAPFCRVQRPEPLLRTQPPCAPFRRFPASFGSDLVGDDSVPEPWAVSVQIDRGVRKMRVASVASGYGISLPFEERLLAKAQHPAGHRHRNSVSGKVKDQREHHLGSDACDRYAAALLRISFFAPAARCAFHREQLGGVSLGDAVFDDGDLQPALQAGLRDAETLCDPADRGSPRRATTTTSRRNCNGNALSTLTMLT